MRIRRGIERRGLAAMELVIATTIVGVALCVLTVAASRGRAQARASESLSNLRQIGSLLMQYSGDNAGASPSYSWQANVTYPSTYPELRVSSDALGAATNQATDILRRRGAPTFARPANWIPHILYSQLVLIDYAQLSALDRVFVSPGDAALLGWRANPASAPDPRVPYSSSYEFTPSMFYAGQTASGGSLTNAGTHNTFTYLPGSGVDSVRLGPQALGAMRAPSQKVLVVERFQRFLGARQPIFMAPEARVPVLMGDGGAGIRAAREASAGAYTRANGTLVSASMQYSPGANEPPASLGAAVVDGRIRWTARLLAGTDFGPALP